MWTVRIELGSLEEQPVLLSAKPPPLARHCLLSLFTVFTLECEAASLTEQLLHWLD